MNRCPWCSKPMKEKLWLCDRCGQTVIELALATNTPLSDAKRTIEEQMARGPEDV